MDLSMTKDEEPQMLAQSQGYRSYAQWNDFVMLTVWLEIMSQTVTTYTC